MQKYRKHSGHSGGVIIPLDTYAQRKGKVPEFVKTTHITIYSYSDRVDCNVAHSTTAGKLVTQRLSLPRESILATWLNTFSKEQSELEQVLLSVEITAALLQEQLQSRRNT